MAPERHSPHHDEGQRQRLKVLTRGELNAHARGASRPVVIRGDGRVLRLSGSPRALLRSGRNEQLRQLAARASSLTPIEYRTLGGVIRVTAARGEATVRIAGVRVARRAIARSTMTASSSR